MIPQDVRTDRLSLPLWSADDAADIRAGRRHPDWHPDFPREDDRDAAGMQGATAPAEGDPWGARSIVWDGVAVGSIGFFGPPSPAPDGVPETEVGYGLVEAARGRGLATEALAALLVHTDLAGVRIRASFEAVNVQSMRVLAKCGFTEVRGTDEEGQLVMARPLRG